MATTYQTPGVYIESLPAAVNTAQGASTSIGALVGISQRGSVGVAELVTSWEQYKNTFAYGLTSPFYANSYLAYAVFGFFANGGSQLYVVRAATASAAKSTAALKDTAATPATWANVDALDEGTWGDSLTVNVTAGSNANTYKITVSYSGTVVETFDNLTIADSSAATYAENIINNGSSYITLTVVNGALSPNLTAGDVSLAGGNDGESGITAADYTTALSALDKVTVNLIAVPGSDDLGTGVVSALKTYCESRGRVIGIIEPKKTENDPDSVLASTAVTASDNLAVYWPWVTVTDPLSKAKNPVKTVPPAGHIMGTIARTDNSRGVWKAPAGLQADLRNVISLAYTADDAENATLYTKQVNVLRVKSNSIVIWGARTLSTDPTLLFISVERTLFFIEDSLYDGTQYAVEEPNNAVLWRRLRTTANTFLLNLFREGAFAGAKPTDAFYVKCDGTINDAIAQDNGVVYLQVGVAPVKPGEFVVIQIGQIQG